MSSLSLVNVCKSYKNGCVAVKDFNLEIKNNEFVIFVGPSGCGKSTTLRMIAGLEDISSGELWIDDQLVNMVEPKNRDLSMVFQNYALYPHMTVYQNMAFSLKVRHMDRQEIDHRVREAAAILEIGHLLDRKPGALSGGQKQRVAIGSVIVRQPKVFLMDEPLSNLDAKLRTQMRVELSKLHRELKTTVIYVTHDQVEAMTLGSKIVVMKEGHVQQVAPPGDLYQNPVNKFVAGFIGSPSMNFFTVLVKEKEGEVFLCMNETDISVDDICAKKLRQRGYVGREVILGIRPEDLHQESEASCCVTMEVSVREVLGAEVLLHGTIGEEPVSVSLKPCCKVQPYERISLSVDISRIKVFDMETEENILYV